MSEVIEIAGVLAVVGALYSRVLVRLTKGID